MLVAPTEVAAMTERVVTSPWIESPRWDVLWMFAGLWAPALAVLSYVLLHGTASEVTAHSFGASVEGVAFIYLPLSILHRITTTYAVLGTPILREVRRMDRMRYYYVPAVIVAVCVLFSLAFTFHDAFAFMPSLHGRLWGFFALAYVMFAWERWHFCAQEFGVLSIYRVRSRQSAARDKLFDRVFTMALMLVVNTVLVFRAGFEDLRKVILHDTPLSSYRGELLEPIALIAFGAGALFTLAAMAREFRHAQRSIPKLWFYLLVGCHSLLLYFFPKALGLFFLSYVFHHWMVSIGLFSRVTLHAFEARPSPAVAPSRAPLAQLLLGVGPFLALTLVFYLVCQQLDRAGSLSPVPSAMIFAGASTGAKVLAGVIIGVFFAINYLHFYYDRCFYAFSTPTIRKTVAPLLFRSPGPRPDRGHGAEPAAIPRPNSAKPAAVSQDVTAP